MGAAKHLLIVLLLAQLCFPLWTVQLNVSVMDLGGKPVEKAQVMVTYQKSSQVSETDGMLTGETNADGQFTGLLSNRVSQSIASRNVQVRISTVYWTGETRKIIANESDSRPVRFVVPFKLEEVYVRALSSRKVPVKNADVLISGKTPIKKQTGADGKARFFFPQNFSFSGYVSFSNTSKRFFSSESQMIEGKSTISVVLPQIEGEILGSVAGSGRNSLAIGILGFNGSGIIDRKVLLEFDAKNYSVYTDSDGVVGMMSDKTGQLNLTVREYDFDYKFSFNLSEGNNTTAVALSHLLRIESFKPVPNGTNCFRLVANVSDPRPAIPLRVRMFGYQSSKNATPLKVNTTASGMYYSELCIRSDTPVRVTASNKYDADEATLNLTFVRPPPTAPTKPANVTPLPGTEPVKQKETDDMVVVGLVLLVVCLVAAFFARAYLSRSSRFMIEYLRKTNEGIEKRRKKPGIPPVQPLPPSEQPPAA